MKYNVLKAVHKQSKAKRIVIHVEHLATIQLITLVNNISKTTQNGEKTDAVFLDLEKAFTKVWQGNLFHKLL